MRIRLLSLALLSLVFVPAGHAATAPQITWHDNGRAQTTVVAKGFQLDTGKELKCPNAETDPCATTIVARAMVGGRSQIVGITRFRLNAGWEQQILVLFNQTGAQALRSLGRIPVTISITSDGSWGPQTLPTITQSVSIPPKVVTRSANKATVGLAPYQRLVVRLGGESGSTGYAWTFDPLQKIEPALRMLDDSTIPDGECPTGTVGCPVLRQVIYIHRIKGVQVLHAGLFGPSSEDPAEEFELTVKTA